MLLLHTASENAIFVIDVKCSILYFKYAMKVLTLGDELLRQKSLPVEEVRTGHIDLIRDLIRQLFFKPFHARKIRIEPPVFRDSPRVFQPADKVQDP